MTDNIYKPVNIKDKRAINGKTDINQLVPFKYPWAWKFFLQANNNHWTPLDVQMLKDVEDYNIRLTDAEKHVFENVLAYLTTSDILALRNIALAVMEKMTSPELQIYQAKQIQEEALHVWTYQHCIETIGLDQGEIYNRYRTVPSINNKIQFSNRMLEDILDPYLDLTIEENLYKFLKSYFFFSCIFEGTWFYHGFTPIFALQRLGLMKGTCEQLQYILRDELLHIQFGIRVIKTIMEEEDIKIPFNEIKSIVREAESCESDYIDYILEQPIRGYNKNDHMEQFKFIINRRMKQLGYPLLYDIKEPPIRWLDEQTNIKKDKNFFETRVTEYEVAHELVWD